MFCCLELVSCRLAVATDCRLELQPVVTNIPKCEFGETGSRCILDETDGNDIDATAVDSIPVCDKTFSSFRLLPQSSAVFELFPLHNIYHHV